MRIEDVIEKPLISEKGIRLHQSQNQYLFRVHREATKNDIRLAVENLFNVGVKDVRTINVRGHVRRMGQGHGKRHNWKKAIVTLKEGDAIEGFGGA